MAQVVSPDSTQSTTPHGLVIDLGEERRRRSHAGEQQRPAFPELAQSPELALIMGIYGILSPKKRKQLTASIMALAWRNGGSGLAAPNAAYDLLNRLEAAMGTKAR